MTPDPLLNDRFPIEDGLSPPRLYPVHECAEAVHVSGFVPHAVVTILANGTEVLAEEQPHFGFADLLLKRAVHVGETLTATQTIPQLMLTSQPSSPVLTVQPLPVNEIQTTEPVVGGPLYTCGRIVPVSNLVAGCRVRVTEILGGNAYTVGTDPAATNALAVQTQPLKGGLIVAQQVGCEGSDHEVQGLDSYPPVQVWPTPSPIPAPHIDKGSLVAGNDAVLLTGLLIGSLVEVFAGGVQIAGGKLATHSANLVPTDPRLTNSPVTATQSLCGNSSPPSHPETPGGQLAAPQVLEPICDGAHFVIVRGTTVNAIVVVLRDGSPVAYGGASPSDVVLELGSGQTLKTGNKIKAIQYIGSIMAESAEVVVGEQLRAPAIEVIGGHTFFEPKPLDEPIDGPVFPRGFGSGPVINVQTCCAESAEIKIVDPNGNIVAQPPLTELFPGYWTAHWRWPQAADGLAAGRYTVFARSGCTPDEGKAHFYVIFNPAEVNGPPRFSFDDTAVWFGYGKNALFGLHYYLHLSDRRLFMLALDAINGIRDPFSAAHVLATKEEALFAYTVESSANDVIVQLTTRRVAQCADDACVLVAMLRAMGIPAHPVTVDAAQENNPNQWGFDTWLEFLAEHNGYIEWRVFHPHQTPGRPAQSRNTFVIPSTAAMPAINDIIVMANEKWPATALDNATADVSYARNSCGQPEQNLTKADWVDELCEVGYWAAPHWDCNQAMTRSLSATVRVSDPIAFAGILRGTLELTNAGPDTQAGPLVIELLDHRVDVKALGADTYGEASFLVKLAANSTSTYSFEIALPTTTPPATELLLHVKLADRGVLQQTIDMPVGVNAEVRFPADIIAGDEEELHVKIRNTSTEIVTDVGVDLHLPYALKIQQDGCQRAGDLEPGAESVHRWTLVAASPLCSGSLHIHISTSNSGGVIIRRPFRIHGQHNQSQHCPSCDPIADVTASSQIL